MESIPTPNTSSEGRGHLLLIKFHCVSMEPYITLHGIKNVTSRTGSTVLLQPTQEKKSNPVLALKDYISCTDTIRPIMGLWF